MRDWVGCVEGVGEADDDDDDDDGSGKKVLGSEESWRYLYSPVSNSRYVCCHQHLLYIQITEPLTLTV